MCDHVRSYRALLREPPLAAVAISVYKSTLVRSLVKMRLSDVRCASRISLERRITKRALEWPLLTMHFLDVAV